MSIYDDEEELVKSKVKKTLEKKVRNKKAKNPIKKKSKEVNLGLDNSIVSNNVILEKTQDINPTNTNITQTVVYKPEPDYIKHLIECKCHLPQFEHLNPIPNHKFIVFSAIEPNGNFVESYAQCNNCGIVHRIIEFETSFTIKKESLLSLQTIDDLKTTVPEWLTTILTQYNCDLHVWQEAKYILDNELWGRFVILTKEHERTITFGKALHIIGTKLFKIDNFERNDDDVKPY